MSWLFSQALVEEYSAGSCSAGEPCAPLNVMPSQWPFWRNDKTMDVLKRSPFGLTWKPLTEGRGEELLMSFRAAFRARTSVAPEREQASKARKADCGGKWPASLAKYDRASRSWKTAQCSLFGGLDEFSATWPRWGTMRNGECFQRPTPSGLSALRAVIDRHLTICGSESGLSQEIRCPTASATSFDSTRPNELGGEKMTEFLRRVPQRLHTATQSDGMGGPGCSGRDGGLNLRTAIQTQRLTTPQSHDALTGNPDRVGRFGTKHFGRNLNDEIAAMVKTQRAPTPRSEDSQCAGGHRGTADTPVAFTRMPTPQASEAHAGSATNQMQTMLTHAVKRMGTPRLSDAKDSGPVGSKSHEHMMEKQYLCAQVKAEAGGQLNPQWEDWFMGWPIGWTDARHSAMVRFRQWLDSHGGCSMSSAGREVPMDGEL